jgi:3-methyl-2-oxobutanoate hydroxymethyltransferase
VSDERTATLIAGSKVAAGADPVVMITAYDFASARIADAAGVDMILVGDSAATTVLGYATTRELPVDELLVLTRAVARGVKRAMVVGDLPFGTYEASDATAVAAARRFAEAGCDAVKLEGAGAMVDRVRAIIAAGIPVVGHVGLLPQGARSFDELRARGRTAAEARRIVDDAVALAAAGCMALVVEAVPSVVARECTRRVDVPVIGIGAGSEVDGQVLVFHDLLGLTEGHQAKFVRRYAELGAITGDAIARYAADVRARRFPSAAEEYGMAPAERAAFLDAGMG